MDAHSDVLPALFQTHVLTTLNAEVTAFHDMLRNVWT